MYTQKRLRDRGFVSISEDRRRLLAIEIIWSTLTSLSQADRTYIDESLTEIDEILREDQAIALQIENR